MVDGALPCARTLMASSSGRFVSHHIILIFTQKLPKEASVCLLRYILSQLARFDRLICPVLKHHIEGGYKLKGKISRRMVATADERERPTTACYMLNRLSSLEAKIRFLAYQFISSNVGSAWFYWQNAKDLSEIQSETAAEFLIEVCPSVSETTAKRRAQTLASWLKMFLEQW